MKWALLQTAGAAIKVKAYKKEQVFLLPGLTSHPCTDQ